LLEAGADKISVNSAAVRRPELLEDLAKAFGSQFVVIAIDARQVDNDWIVYLNGGRIVTERRLFDWAKESEARGAGEILFTSMNHDGAKTGFACAPMARLADSVSIPIIASGGAGTMAHFLEVFTEGKADAGLAASIFHFGEISIGELKTYLHQEGIPVRMG